MSYSSKLEAPFIELLFRRSRESEIVVFSSNVRDIITRSLFVNARAETEDASARTERLASY